MTKIVLGNPELGINHADAGGVDFFTAMHVVVNAKSDGVRPRDTMTIADGVTVETAESGLSEADGASSGIDTFAIKESVAGQGDGDIVAGSGQGGSGDGAGYDGNVIFIIGSA